jgi:NADP-dependent 3-hydroxy acid dehydrogenase YdfG
VPARALHRLWSVIISGSHAAVTGANGGLGQAISRRLRHEGARPTLTARRTAVLEALAAELGAQVVAAELAESASVRVLVAPAWPS